MRSNLTPAQLGAIDEICEEFEDAFRSGEPLSIESLIPAEWSIIEKSWLLKSLVEIEFELLTKSGADVPTRDYYRRFPGYREELDVVFADAKRQRLPDRIGPYKIHEPIGRGGMGTVYRAEHQNLGRFVALKVLPVGTAFDESALKRFEREMLAIGSLSHPNIVQATDADHRDDVHYLAMELIDGLNLTQLIDLLGPLEIPAACEVVRQAANALHYAHRHGFIHRDVKPSNLMVTSAGTVKLLDMGLASVVDAQRELTDSGQVLGTIEYMAPEQANRATQVDARSDVFSLGATLFKLLTGVSPVDATGADSKVSKLTALIRGELPSIRSLRDDVPNELCAAIDEMLAIEPANRTQSSAEVVEAVTPFCGTARLKEVLHGLVGDSTPVIETQSLRDARISTSVPSIPAKRSENEAPVKAQLRTQRSRLPLVFMACMLAIGAGSFLSSVRNTATPSWNSDDTVASEITDNADGTLVDTNPFDNLPVVEPPNIEVKSKTWKRGPTDTTFHDGLVPFPSVSPIGVKWQLYCTSPTHSFERPEVTWSPDGRWITIGESGCTKLFDFAERKLRKVGPSGALSWSDDAKWIAADKAAAVHFWSPYDLPPHVDPKWNNSNSSGWRPGDDRFGRVNRGEGRIINLQQRDSVVFESLPELSKGVWSPSGEWLAVYSDGKPVRIYRDDGTLEHVLGANMHVPSDIDDFYNVNIHWSPQSDRLAFGSRASVEVWNVDEKVLEPTKPLSRPPRSIRWNPQGSLLAAIEQNGPILIWDNLGRSHRDLEPTEEAFVSIHWTSKKRLVARDEVGKLWLYDFDLAVHVGQHDGPEFGMVGEYSPDNRKLVLSGFDELRFIDFDHVTPAEVDLFEQEQDRFEKNHLRVAWSPHSDRFLRCDQCRGTWIQDLRSGKAEPWLPSVPTIKSLAWNKEGSRLATLTNDGAVQIWANSGGLESIADVNGVSFDWHPNGRHLVVADRQGQCKIWDSQENHTATLTDPFPSSRPRPKVVAFQPDGSSVAIATDEALYSWQWRETRKLTKWSNDGAAKLQWDPSGKWLTTTSPPRRLEVWVRKIRRFTSRATQTLRVFKGKDSVGTLQLPSAPHYGNFALAPDGKVAISIGTAADGIPQSMVVDLVQTEVVAGETLPGSDFESVRSMAWHPSGEWIAVATENGVRVLQPDGSRGWDLDASQHLTDNIAVDFSPDGRWLAVAGKNRIAVWDCSLRQLSRLIFLFPNHEAAVFSPAGELLWHSARATEHIGVAVEDNNKVQRIHDYVDCAAVTGLRP